MPMKIVLEHTVTAAVYTIVTVTGLAMGVLFGAAIERLASLL
jgi:hypothetical protein